MAEIIDLTVDDTPVRKVPAKRQGSGSDLLCLLDDFDAPAILDDVWEEDRPSKRRKSTPLSDLLPKEKAYRQGSETQQEPVASAIDKILHNSPMNGSKTVPWDLSSEESLPDYSCRIAGGTRNLFGFNSDEDATARSQTLKRVANEGPSFRPGEPALSDRTAALLAGLQSGGSFESSSARWSCVTTRDPGGTNLDDAGSRPGRYGAEHRKPGADSQNGSVEEDDVVLPGPNTSKATKSKATDREKERQAQDKTNRNREKQQRLKEKEAEQERKRKLKEEKAREKQAAAELAQVNKSRTDKKVSTPEMIVDLPEILESGPQGAQLRTFLKNIGAEVCSYIPLVPNIIKWRRKVTAVYDDSMGYWRPIPEAIQQEAHALCLMPAAEFVQLACVEPDRLDGQDLDAHVLRFKSNFEDCKPIYLIEGLTSWMRKNKNVRNRAYQAAVLRQMGDGQSSDSQPQPQRSHARRNQLSPEYIDEDMIEDALLRLQVMHKCLIHHTVNSTETAEWVSIFTQHISTIPYRYAFCSQRRLLPVGS